MTWTAYPESQPTGDPEIGEAPRDWEVIKLRHLLALNPPVPAALRNSKEEASFLPMELIGEDGSLDLSRSRPVDEVLSGYSYFAEGDVLFAKVTPCFENGKAALVRNLPTGHGFGTTEVTTMRPGPRLDQAFLGYLVRSDRFRQSGIAAMTGAGGLKRVPDQHVRDFRLALPSSQEQKGIVRFLDRKTAKIDALIAKQEQLIATLREDRTATITHAVTKGLDPDAEMKDSGVEWIGLTPAHWRQTQMRYLVDRIEQGVSPQADAELAETGWGVLKAGCVNGGVFAEAQHKKLPEDFTIDPSIVVRTGDLLVSRASGSPDLVGSTAVVGDLRYQLILSDKTFRLVPSLLTSARYLEWAMNSRMYREQVRGAISGAEGLANNLPMTALKTFRFALPPIVEQERIAAHLLAECLKVDTLIGKADEVISTLREYRATLITDAVTGKINVRRVA